MKEDLTKKQERVFSFLVKYGEENGFPPTVREIADNLGLAGPNSAKKYLDILERKKYIKKFSGKPRAIEIRGNPLSRGKTRSVPVIGQIAAGIPILAIENIESRISIDTSIAKWDDVFLLRVRGDSMIEAHILDNDLVFIKPKVDVESGEIAAVLIDNEATVKRFFREKGHIILKPENPSMKPVVLKDGDVRIIGKVVGVIRTDISKNSMGHRA